MPTGLDQVQLNIKSAFDQYNEDHTTAWSFGTNWNNVKTDFQTFVNNYLFPKINSTELIDIALGNRFNWLAKEVDFIGQYSEEYVFLDSIPLNMNLSKQGELMLKRNYKNVASKLYGQGTQKKVKFTLNDNDARHNFSTLGDAVNYAIGHYNKALSDINVSEESEIKGMLVDYATRVTSDKRVSTSLEDTLFQINLGILNLQNNSAKYNETALASGGTIGRYTTKTDLQNIGILTSDEVKAHLLDSHIANMFQVQGLDISNKIISFDDLGGTYKLTDDVTITSQDTINQFRIFGDYQIELGDILFADTIITFDVTELSEFVGKVEEVKPESNLFAYVFDVNKIRYKRYTKNMHESFRNPEFQEVHHWLHYNSMKNISPFYNNFVING